MWECSVYKEVLKELLSDRYTEVKKKIKHHTCSEANFGEGTLRFSEGVHYSRKGGSQKKLYDNDSCPSQEQSQPRSGACC